MSWWKWLLVLALAGHAFALYAPGGPDPGVFSGFPEGTDKVVHVMLFAAPAFLLRMITRKWWPVALLVLHAPISELIQWRFVPYRSGDALDLVADLLGIALGVAAAEIARTKSAK
jgi:hypothetical protein